MLILFDRGTPAPLRSFFKEHTVKKTRDLGWDTLSNGELLSLRLGQGAWNPKLAVRAHQMIE
jgi:hypothetical protein